MLKNRGGSPRSSVSDDLDMSDPGDPIHSESILQELFYKNPVCYLHSAINGYRNTVNSSEILDNLYLLHAIIFQ